MKSTLLIVLFILVCPIIAIAQANNCTMKLAELTDSPDLFGFRMGMTEEQVKQRVPQVRFPPPTDFGLAKTTINPDFDPSIDKASLSGVRTISLDFLDGRVTSLWFGFDTTYKWHTVPEFVVGISRALRLPDAWTDWKARGQQITCADFLMNVSVVAEGPSFHIIDETAEKLIAERRATKEAENSASEDEPVSEIVADRTDKVYYVAGCLPLHGIPEKDRLVFKSREAAEKAGYKLAGRCQ